MKQLYKSLLILPVLLSLNSCSDDFLNRPPMGVFTEDNFFLSPDAGFNSVVKVYQTLNDFYGYEAPRAELGNMPTDDSEKGGSDAGDRPWVTDIGAGRALSTNTSLANYWSTLYLGIGNANIALEQIPINPLVDASGYRISDEVKARYIAELKFLRSFFYFELVKVFGGVPLLDKTLTVKDIPSLARATEEESFLFIMKDLDEAEAEVNLPSKSALPANELGRITKEAVWAMQAKVYMFFAKDDPELFVKARDAAKKVINSGNYTLEPRFQSLFLTNGYKSNESILVNISGDDPGSFIYGSFIPIYTSPRGPTGAWGFDQPTQNLVDEFEAGDPRLLFTIIEPGDKFSRNPGEEKLDFSSYPSTGYHNRKSYLPPNRRGLLGWGDDAWSYHIIRYADILLLYAESLIHTNGSAKDIADNINLVRRRANNSRQDDVEAISRTRIIQNKNLPDVLQTADLTEAVRHERRVELAMEYNRFYDLKRWNIYVETMNEYSALPGSNNRGADFQKGKNEYFPIPQVEIDRSGGVIKQNKGYN